MALRTILWLYLVLWAIYLMTSPAVSLFPGP
jgi:hypothetical protein